MDAAAEVESAAPAGVAERTTGQRDSVTSGDRRPPPSGGGGPGPAGKSPTDALTAFADSISVDVETLKSSVEDGSFSDLLKSKDVDTKLGLIFDQSA